MQTEKLDPAAEVAALQVASGFKYKAVYTAEDLNGIAYLDSRPGEWPFLRGPYASMYTQRPWTIRQYAGFGDASSTNRLYREAVGHGAKGLSIAFDLPTHRGWDSDSPQAIGDVGKAGVAIDSVEDMKVLLSGLPLDEVSISMTMNGAVLPVMAAFIVAAEELGFSLDALAGTIQNDILKEFMVRNTYIFSPEVSLRIAADIVEYNAQHLPRFNSMSISGYHFQEAGADPILELALTLANAKTYIEYAIRKGWDINRFCEHLTFFFCVGSDFYLEIAKLRASRVLWADMLQAFGVVSPKALALRMHCQTSGWSLVAGDPLNNIARTTAQAMAAAFGGTQSLHTNAYDEAYSLPTEMSARVARDTQQILQLESGICQVVDPWAGSYMMERITADVVAQVKEILAEIEGKGGMLPALDAQWIQRLIQTRAAQTQARLDTGMQAVVGRALEASHASSLHVDAHAIRQQQAAGIVRLKQSRDTLSVRRALKQLTQVAQQGQGNLLAATIDAIRARATVQECTDAITRVSPRHAQSPILMQGVYGDAIGSSPAWQLCRQAVSDTASRLQRAPRVLVCKVGQDGHDRGANVVAAILHDAGCHVKPLALFSDIEQIVSMAASFEPDLVAVSSLANAHNALMPALMQALRGRGLMMPVVLGGIIPHEDHAFLRAQGVAYVLAPGHRLSEAIPCLMQLIRPGR